MSARDTQELIKAVQDALAYPHPIMPTSESDKAEAALIELAKRLQAAEQENELLKALDEIEPVAELHARAEAAESLNRELVKGLKAIQRGCEQWPSSLIRMIGERVRILLAKAKGEA